MRVPARHLHASLLAKRHAPSAASSSPALSTVSPAAGDIYFWLHPANLSKSSVSSANAHLRWLVRVSGPSAVIVHPSGTLFSCTEGAPLPLRLEGASVRPLCVTRAHLAIGSRLTLLRTDSSASSIVSSPSASSNTSTAAASLPISPSTSSSRKNRSSRSDSAILPEVAALTSTNPLPDSLSRVLPREVSQHRALHAALSELYSIGGLNDLLEQDAFAVTPIQSDHLRAARAAHSDSARTDVATRALASLIYGHGGGEARHQPPHRGHQKPAAAAAARASRVSKPASVAGAATNPSSQQVAGSSLDPMSGGRTRPGVDAIRLDRRSGELVWPENVVEAAPLGWGPLRAVLGDLNPLPEAPPPQNAEPIRLDDTRKPTEQLRQDAEEVRTLLATSHQMRPTSLHYEHYVKAQLSATYRLDALLAILEARMHLMDESLLQGELQRIEVGLHASVLFPRLWRTAEQRSAQAFVSVNLLDLPVAKDATDLRRLYNRLEQLRTLENLMHDRPHVLDALRGVLCAELVRSIRTLDPQVVSDSLDPNWRASSSILDRLTNTRVTATPWQEPATLPEEKRRTEKRLMEQLLTDEKQRRPMSEEEHKSFTDHLAKLDHPGAVAMAMQLEKERSAHHEPLPLRPISCEEACVIGIRYLTAAVLTNPSLTVAWIHLSKLYAVRGLHDHSAVCADRALRLAFTLGVETHPLVKYLLEE